MPAGYITDFYQVLEVKFATRVHIELCVYVYGQFLDEVKCFKSNKISVLGKPCMNLSLKV